MQHDTLKENICIIGIFILGIIGAIQGKWDVAMMCVTGGFALLRSHENRKEPANEKASPAAGPGSAA